MTSNDNQSVEDSREYLREQLAPRIRSLFDLRRAGGLPLEFISFPHAPHERTFHNRSKQEYPLGCYRIPTGLFVGGHGLLLAGQDFILMEQNGDTIIEESYTAVPGQLEPVVPRIPQGLSLLAAPSYNFYHWLVDSLPKVIVAEACGFTGMYLIPMAIMNKDAHEGLALLGIPPARLLRMHFPPVIVDDMWVPTHFHGHEMERTPTLHAMFRNRMLATLSSVRGPGARRLYVKRAESRGERTVTNGEEVEGLLREFDFTVVSMEQFSTAQQMVLARDAEVMFGPHGAGMVHNLWMAPGSTVIELLPVTYQNHCMEVHARLLGHRYHGFVVENLSGKNNMCVDVAELRSLFKLIGL